MQYNNEIQEIIFSNYEDLRLRLIRKYNNYLKVKENNTGMFHVDIDRNFIQMVHSFVTAYITQRSVIAIDVIKVYVEDKFCWDNIERIISENGEV